MGGGRSAAGLTSPAGDLLTRPQDVCGAARPMPAHLPPHPLLLKHWRSTGTDGQTGDRQTGKAVRDKLNRT